ncbi:MAG: DUF1697 domain-containing protein [Melioribacteraceae bacterium]|nr:DUF1697 domain-containing protein [Melioribacteraceae bacterium]MCF8264987.1 DUF1697 domain-containing protein [Melioribacteraceae bacterium]MCF8431468.1 DUF1697 domain-containing protein [Melioribacteraceae bacterium]
MKTYIALFRGINVGGNNILPMKGLVEVLAKMGLENVQTYIQSGNVTFSSNQFDSNQLAYEISRNIFHKFGFEPKILILSSADLKKTIDNNPFPVETGKLLHFFFLSKPSKVPDLEQILKLKSESEEFKLTEKVFYLFAPEGIGRSKLAAKVERCLGVSVTARNWNTISKIISMIDTK